MSGTAKSSSHDVRCLVLSSSKYIHQLTNVVQFLQVEDHLEGSIDVIRL